MREKFFDWAFVIDNPTEEILAHIKYKSEHDWFVCYRMNQCNQIVGVASHRNVPCTCTCVERLLPGARYEPLVGNLCAAVCFINNL